MNKFKKLTNSQYKNYKNVGKVYLATVNKRKR